MKNNRKRFTAEETAAFVALAESLQIGDLFRRPNLKSQWKKDGKKQRKAGAAHAIVWTPRPLV